MEKNHKNRDLSADLLSRRVLALEDRVLYPTLIVAALLAGLFSAILRPWESPESEQTEIVRLYSENWVLRHLDDNPETSDRQNFQSVSEEGILVSNHPALKNSTDVSYISLKNSTGPEIILMRNDSILGRNNALLIPASSLPLLSHQSYGGLQFLGILSLLIAAIIFTQRMILQKLIFKPITILSRTLFTRRVYFATGAMAFDRFGKPLDGRKHFLKNAYHNILHFLNLDHLKQDAILSDNHDRIVQTQRGQVVLERIPEAPHIKLENFSNDELGRVALALEEGFVRQQRYEDLLKDVFECLPKAVIVINHDGQIFYANKTFKFSFKLDDTAVQQLSTLPLSTVLKSQWNFSDSTIARIQGILDGSAPRVSEKITPMMRNGQEIKLSLSVSGFNNHGKRMCVLLFDQPDDTTQSSQFTDAILYTASLQLSSIQRLSFGLQNLNIDQGHSLFSECEHLVDHINGLFDLTHFGQKRYLSQNFEFNIVLFFHDLPSTISSRFPLNLSLHREVPTFVQGDPANLRQCIKTICDSYKEANQETSLKIVVTRQNKNELRVSFESGDKSAIKKHMRVAQLLQRFLPYFKFKIDNESDLLAHEFLSFRFPLLIGSGEKNIFNLTDKDKLDNKNILFLHTGVQASIETDQILAQLTCAEKFRLSTQMSATTTLNDVSHKWNVAVIFTQVSHWHGDESLKAWIKELKLRQIPAIVIPGTPRRGDSRHAIELGFSGYLSRPFVAEELESLLILACHQSFHQSSVGLLTRHSMRDFMQNIGKVLVAHFETRDIEPAESLNANLNRMGFQVSKAQGAHQFFELLHNSEFDFVFVPMQSIGGLKRRVQMALRGQKVINYATDPSTLTPELLRESRVQGWVNLSHTDNPAAVTQAIQEHTLQEVTDISQNLRDIS